MVLLEVTVKDVTVTPPIIIGLASVKLVPSIITVSPAEALVGEKELIVGAGINVKPANDTVPSEVVINTLPDEVPEATSAVIVVDVTTVNEVAIVPPKLTAVAFVKLLPVIVTVVPAPALVGVKESIVGIKAVNSPPV
jgi:hypothetical protein